MITVDFTGVIGEKFGTGYTLDVSSPRDAIRALSLMIDGLDNYIRHNDFYVWIDDRNIGEYDVGFDYGDCTVKVGLHVSGAGGGGGIFAVIAGIALIVVGVFFPAVLPAGAQMLAIGLGAGIAAVGASMLLMPKANAVAADQDGNKASYGFNNTVTTVAQGNNVPVLYGKGLVGGFVISYRITTDDITGA